MKWIDVPPVWLLGFIVLTYWIRAFQPDALSLGGTIGWGIGTMLVAVGLILILLAALQMQRHRTTIIPHQEAARLVTTGIFGRSRNPIYLGDALIFSGLALRWEVPIALGLVPVFTWIITQRFIIAEEQRLMAKFPAEFTRYRETTPRWV